MKPKIGWLINGHAGTGGGRITIMIGNELIKRGYDLTFYSADKGGIDFICSAPTLPLDQAKGDVIICADMGRGYKVFEQFRDSKAETKIWYTILLTNEFLPAITMKEVIKMASTTHFFRQFNKLNLPNVTLNIGPMDLTNFYPLNLVRNDMILVYAKKAGWVGPLVGDYIYKHNNKAVVGAMGLIELGDQSHWVVSTAPYIDMSIPSHLTSILNGIYNKSNMYIECCGCESWGFNYMIGEAMACSLPVIAPNWEGFDHLVIEGETALTVPFDSAQESLGANWMVRPSPELLAIRALELFNNQPLRDKLTNNARELISNYSIPKWIDRLEEIWA